MRGDRGSTGPTRRAVVAAALALPLTACTGGDGGTHGRPTSGPSADPDAPLRAAATARERDLLAAYDAALAGAALSPARRAALGALRAEHAEHLTALGAAAPTPAAPAPSAAPPVVVDLSAAEATASAGHAGDVPNASRVLAGVLASLAASEASHAVVLEAVA